MLMKMAQAGIVESRSLYEGLARCEEPAATEQAVSN
jgi:hypothetical protein